MVDVITAWLVEYGYLAVFALMIAENIFPPIPSELIIPLVGYSVAKGDLSAIGALVAAVAGAIVGCLPWYFAARAFGRRGVVNLVVRMGPWLGFTRHDFLRGQRLFNRLGWLAVVLGRLMPGLRTLVSVPAGVYCMPLPLFTVCSAVGSLFWVSALMSAGFLLAAHYGKVAGWLDPVAITLLVILAALYATRVLAIFRRRARISYS